MKIKIYTIIKQEQFKQVKLKQSHTDRLKKEGIIAPVTHSQWAAPIVTVPKKDGKFRICGDYKVTINQALVVEEYPLPTLEELFSMLSGGKVFF